MCVRVCVWVRYSMVLKVMIILISKEKTHHSWWPISSSSTPIRDLPITSLKVSTYKNKSHVQKTDSNNDHKLMFKRSKYWMQISRHSRPYRTDSFVPIHYTFTWHVRYLLSVRKKKILFFLMFFYNLRKNLFFFKRNATLSRARSYIIGNNNIKSL